MPQELLKHIGKLLLPFSLAHVLDNDTLSCNHQLTLQLQQRQPTNASNLNGMFMCNFHATLPYYWVLLSSPNGAG